MTINWWLLELRDPPSPASIAACVKMVKAMPACPGAGDNIMVPFDATTEMIPDGLDWSQSKVKLVKFKKLSTVASDTTIDRAGVLWHIQNPGQSKHGEQHPQVVKLDSGTRVIANGHHRLTALALLGQSKDAVWQLKQ